MEVHHPGKMSPMDDTELRGGKKKGTVFPKGRGLDQEQDAKFMRAIKLSNNNNNNKNLVK